MNKSKRLPIVGRSRHLGQRHRLAYAPSIMTIGANMPDKPRLYFEGSNTILFAQFVAMRDMGNRCIWDMLKQGAQ